MNNHSIWARFSPPARPSCLQGLFFIFCLCCALLLSVKADDLLDDDKGLGTMLDDIQQESSNAWWNDDWKFRRKVTINDPLLLGSPDTAIFLSEPEPLLLYNIGHCRDKLADLRAVAADGQLLPCGVTHFGRDDGSSKIWFVPNLREGQTRLEVTLYYGNPKAEAADAGAEVPEGRNGDPQFMRIGTEEVRPGAVAPGAVARSFFRNLLVAEAESFTHANASGPSHVKSIDAAAASGEKFLTLQDSASPGKPVSVRRTVQVPEAGVWYVHVRYKNPERKQKYESFKLSLGAKEFDCGTNRDEGAAFSWRSMQAELPKGALQLGLHFHGLAAPDTVLLTRDSHYRPDYRDINGPPWMRFKVTNPAPPFYVDLFGTFITTSVNGPQGKTTAYLFRDRAVLPKRTQYGTDNGGIILTSELPAAFKDLPRDPKSLLSPGEWSPWGETLSHGSYTWYSQIRFIAGGKAIGTTPSHLNVASEFATRPHGSRIFHTTSASTGTRNTFNIHMPPALDLDTVRNHTVTFDEWARQRFALAKSLGFKSGEGPKQIVAATIANAQSAAEADSILTTLDWIGLNTVTLQGNGFDQEAVLRRSTIKSFWTYYRTEYKVFNHFYTVDPKEMIISPTGMKEPKLNPRGRMPSLTHAKTVEKIVATVTDKYYRDSAIAAKKTIPWQFSHIRYNDLDDEIGPAVDGRSINSHPLFKGFFVEYLKARGLQPSFFGVKTWDDLEAIDYSDIGKKEKRLEQLNKDAEAAQKKLDEAAEADIDANGNLLHGLDDPIEENDREQKEKARREKEGLPVVERPAPTTFEKRAYYWTQKFRSHYTALFYGYETRAVHKYFPAGVRTCANLQASPIQAGRMWDGGLNIWDLGRQNAFSALQVEDWHTSPVNVSFGMNMARAAGRKNGQPTTALMVLRNPAQRIITNLSQGARYLLFYLYGPVQGDPAFAEDRETLLQIGQTMRKIRRAEADILAAKNRPCDTAILVDNASEINGQYFAYPFDHDRMAVYAALNDQQVPVDLVGAEEVLEDNALSRYKVLYVCDPHIQTRVQQKIKAWVAAGGTLWADYAALARDEYDQPSRLMDEVFGLKTRGTVVPYTIKGYNGTLPPGVTVKIPKGNLLAAETIIDIRYSAVAGSNSGKPDYKLSTGKVLATFNDGNPAIIRNKYGKGQAVLNGFLAGIAYGGQWQPHGYNFSRIAREAPATRTRAQLMTAIARVAGARPHVKIDEHMFWANVHDGPHQSVVYLVNGSRNLKAMPLEVTLPKVPKSAYRGNRQPVPFKVVGTRVVLPLTMAATDCDILVFKY